ICLLGIFYLLSQMFTIGNFSVVMFFTLIGSFRFLENHGANNQVAFIFMFLSLLSIQSKKDSLTGFLLALSIIIKLTPAILFLYFLHQKRYKVIIYTGVFLVGLAALPCVLDSEFGIKQWKNWNEMVLMSAMKSPLFRAWKNNQSLIATLSKYFLTGADPINQSILRMPYVVLEPPVVKQIFLGLTFIIFIPLYLKFKKSIGGFQLFSALMVLSCILSGISWVHSFSFLLFPIFYLFAKSFEYPEEKKLNRSVYISIGLIVFSSKSIVGSSVESVLLMLSILLYISLAIYLLVLSYKDDEYLI
ncbi:MAG: DUF2029 domain-containing protein, partial [Leptospiraceae bacterium]|nr:DUF2029 domain-containing protein [Leptospiraceae bacterium]